MNPRPQQKQLSARTINAAYKAVFDGIAATDFTPDAKQVLLTEFGLDAIRLVASEDRHGVCRQFLSMANTSNQLPETVEELKSTLEQASKRIFGLLGSGGGTTDMGLDDSSANREALGAIFRCALTIATSSGLPGRPGR